MLKLAMKNAGLKWFEFRRVKTVTELQRCMQERCRREPFEFQEWAREWLKKHKKNLKDYPCFYKKLLDKKIKKEPYNYSFSENSFDALKVEWEKISK